MPVYPGDPKSTLKQVAYLNKNGYNDHKLKTVMHVGTHMDAPFHMIKNGMTIDKIAPNNFIGPGILIDVRNIRVIDDSVLENARIIKGSIVLLYTAYSAFYRTKKYYENLPYLTKKFARAMVNSRVKIVGMDMLGPDLNNPWPTHKILLSDEVLILENLTNLDKLLNIEKFEVISLPAKFNADAAPVRVIARIR